MKSLRKKDSFVRCPALDWSSTPEIDGFTWEVGPTDSDARWAAENLNESWDHGGPTPDEIIDREAEEAEWQDRYENGLMF